MSDRSSRSEALAIIQRIKSPHLSINKFPRAQQLYDTARRPFSTIPSTTIDLIEDEITEVVTVIDQAIEELNPETFRAVIDLPHVKAASFGGQATTRRFLRGSGRKEDYVLLSKYLAELRQSLTEDAPNKPSPS